MLPKTLVVALLLTKAMMEPAYAQSAKSQFITPCTDVHGEISRAGLPPGTRIYRADMLEFKYDDGSGSIVTLPGEIVSYDDHSLGTRMTDGTVKTFSNIHFLCRWSREWPVRPGVQLPGLFLGLQPEETLP